MKEMGKSGQNDCRPGDLSAAVWDANPGAMLGEVPKPLTATSPGDVFTRYKVYISAICGSVLYSAVFEFACTICCIDDLRAAVAQW